MRAELETTIERSPGEIFAYLVDVTHLPEWQSGVRSARAEPPGPLAPGSHVHESRRIVGREVDNVLEVTAFEQDRVLALRALRGPVRFEIRHELEPSGGGTRLRIVAEGDTGPLPAIAARAMARQVEKQFRNDVARLKQLLEAR